MKIVKGKIISCTEDELFMYWKKNWSSLFDYWTYREKVVRELKLIKVVEPDED